MTYEEYLTKYGILTYRNTGTSMLPMLKQGRDLFSVECKNEKRCQKYDVVLYRRPPEQYVLHRIVEVRDEGYVILGDNCEKKEYGIKDEDIIGVLVFFVHKGKSVKTTCWKYKIYVHLWCWSYPIRKQFFHIKRLYGAVIRRENKLTEEGNSHDNDEPRR